MNIELSFSPNEEDLKSIYDGLLSFNLPHFPEDIKEQNIALLIRDKNQKIIAGLTGTMILTSLSVKYLWLDERHRGCGLGSQLLERIELEAIKQGVHHIYLDTFTFQAPKFYEKKGFKEVGRYKNFPLAGVDKIFYQKSLPLI